MRQLKGDMRAGIGAARDPRARRGDRSARSVRVFGVSLNIVCVTAACSPCLNFVCAMVASCLAQQTVPVLNRRKGDTKDCIPHAMKSQTTTWPVPSSRAAINSPTNALQPCTSDWQSAGDSPGWAEPLGASRPGSSRLSKTSNSGPAWLARMMEEKGFYWRNPNSFLAGLGLTFSIACCT